MLSKSARCINIDWLEVHALEPIERLLDAEFYRAQGWSVDERPYGTRVYTQMFTLILPNGERFLEIRRAPAASTSNKAAKFFEINSVHIRLCNRTCYIDGCAKMLSDFMLQYGYQFRRISRIDIALDFERFDWGDKPQDFIDRYLRGKYSKINQTNVRAFGKDWWDGRKWNSVSWGAKNSMVGTKIYNKTMELAEAHDKPYIRQAWASAGLVDDFIQLTKKDKDGTFYKPDIWRVEFSIQSSVRGWYTVFHDELGNKKIHSYRNDLDRYATRADLLDVFASLAAHYFHFKHYIADKRKDRCPDKILFDFTSETQTFYQVERVATANPADKTAETLRRRLIAYRETHFDSKLRTAVDIILSALQDECVKKAAVNPHDDTEIALLQRLIALRTANHCESPFDLDLETARKIIALEQEIF